MSYDTAETLTDRMTKLIDGIGTPAVIYTRVSSKEQDKEGFSIPAQEKLLRNYATERGFKIAREFSDVETAKQAGRGGFAAMIAHLRKTNGACRTLLVEKTDRLYRNFRDYVTVDELDLDVHFVKENAVISRDSRSSEKFIHGIKVLMAKNYIDNLSEETRKGMIEKAEQGIWPSYAPIGYRNVLGVDGKRVIEPDDNLAPMVARLFDLCSSGDYSIKQIASIATSEGLGRRGSSRPMATATVHKILRNRIYIGEFEWDGKSYAATHVPIVQRHVWEKVQAGLDRRRAARSKPANRGFAFTGLLTCGHCGCALVGEAKKGKYIYYHCTGYRGNCAEPYARQEVVEREFSGLVRMIAIDAEVLEWVSLALRQSHADERRIHDEAISRLRTEYHRFQNRLDAMYEDRLDGRIDVGLFDRKSRDWRSL